MTRLRPPTPPACFAVTPGVSLRGMNEPPPPPLSREPRAGAPDSLPLPGEALRERVAGTSDLDWFHRSGEQSLEDLRRALQSIDRSIEDYERILDFGCGCGRLLRWLRHLARDRSICGCDIDAESIEWVRKHLPEFNVVVNRELPALDYPSGSFDLIICNSVLTHLDEDYQNAWLQELQRVSAPGATLLVSFSGDHVFSERVSEAEHNGTNPAPFRAQRDRDGILFLRDPGSPFSDFYQATYHAPWYVFRHWSHYFRIHSHRVRGSLDFQDLVVMEREASLQQPGHRADPPAVSRAKETLRGIPGARGARRALRRWVR